MRGQWFTDGTWLPLEEEDSDLIELEHLACFRGHQMKDTFETEAVTTAVDSKDGKREHRVVSITSVIPKGPAPASA